jgi:hypothetical protein
MVLILHHSPFVVSARNWPCCDAPRSARFASAVLAHGLVKAGGGGAGRVCLRPPIFRRNVWSDKLLKFVQRYVYNRRYHVF